MSDELLRDCVERQISTIAQQIRTALILLAASARPNEEAVVELHSKLINALEVITLV